MRILVSIPKLQTEAMRLSAVAAPTLRDSVGLTRNGDGTGLLVGYYSSAIERPSRVIRFSNEGF